MKCNNICIIGIPEGEEVEEKIENLFEKSNDENFLWEQGVNPKKHLYMSSFTNLPSTFCEQ